MQKPFALFLAYIKGLSIRCKAAWMKFRSIFVGWSADDMSD